MFLPSLHFSPNSDCLVNAAVAVAPYCPLSLKQRVLRGTYLTELLVVKGDGWHFLSPWRVVVRRKETVKDRKVEFCQVLSQLMTFSPTVTVLNVSIIPYITWPPRLRRFSPSPRLTSFNSSMNGHFSVELNPSPAHCVLEVSGGKHY